MELCPHCGTYYDDDNDTQPCCGCGHPLVCCVDVDEQDDLEPPARAAIGPTGSATLRKEIPESTQKKVSSPRNNRKDVLKTAGSAATGGATGAGLYATLGGMGLTAGGGAVAITLLPMVLIGAGLFGTAYGLYWLGKRSH